MFDILKEFLGSVGVGVGGSDADDVSVDELQVASAALLYHVIDSDGVVTEAEQARFRDVLAREFEVRADEVDRIARAGRAADAEAVDLYRFTSVLKRRLEREDRVRFVELLWEVTYADGEVHELEDNLIWRVADLLGVSTRDRMLTKREVAEKTGNLD